MNDSTTTSDTTVEAVSADERRAQIADWLYRTFRVDLSNYDFDPAGGLLIALGCGGDGCEAGWVWPTNDPADRFACLACRPVQTEVTA